jgi:hypothetical protein
MMSLLLIESLDLRPSNQYILVSESPSRLRLEKMCVCQVRRRSRWSPRYLTWFSWGICTSFIWTGGHVSRLVVNVTWTDLVSLALIRQSRSQDWIARRVVYSFWEVVVKNVCKIVEKLLELCFLFGQPRMVCKEYIPEMKNGYRRGPVTTYCTESVPASIYPKPNAKDQLLLTLKKCLRFEVTRN